MEEAWRIVDPALKTNTPVYVYEPGSWGPDEVAQHVLPAGGWHNPAPNEQMKVAGIVRSGPAVDGSHKRAECSRTAHFHCPLSTIFLGEYASWNRDRSRWVLVEGASLRLAAAGHEVVDFGLIDWIRGTTIQILSPRSPGRWRRASGARIAVCGSGVGAQSAPTRFRAFEPV